MNLHAIAVDVDLLSGGVWWDYETRRPCEPRTAPHASHFCVLVVPFGDDFRRAYEEASAPHLDDIRKAGGKTPDWLLTKVRGAALGKATLRGWENLEEGGKPLHYSAERSVDFMTDGRWMFLRTFVESAASNEAAVLAAEENSAKGN